MQIALVNHDPIILSAISTLLKKYSTHQVCWQTDNAQDAISICSKQLPDLLLLDIHVKDINGAEVTKIIMQNSPTAILIVTSDGSHELSLIFESMGFGALDAITISLDDEKGIVEASTLLEKIDTIAKLKGKLRYGDMKDDVTRTDIPRMANNEPFPILLAIGASTGGPGALSKILSQLPLNLPLAILIIQHVDEKFIDGLAKWLEVQTNRKVQLAMPGDIPKPGGIMLASRNQHMVIRHNGTVHYTNIPNDISFSPSVDVFFHSLYQNWPRKSIAVLLTGMGTDGAQGLKNLKDKGWHTIAEHEKSCVIYGMPRAAVEKGAAVEIVDCNHMAAAILNASRELLKK